MKIKLAIIIVCILITAATLRVIFFSDDKLVIKSFEQEEMEEGEEETEQAAFAKQRLQYEFDITKDPATGKIPANIRFLELSQALRIPENGGGGIASQVTIQNTYTPVGPNNIGGRTRALAIDARFGTAGNQVMMAGSVSGGIYRSADAGANWTRVSPADQTFSISCIVQDTRPGFQNTWYAGGGEPVGNSASVSNAQYLGEAILKSIDNGVTWAKLSNNYTDQNGTLVTSNGGTPFALETFDNPFDIIHKITINPVNGSVYVAGHRRLLKSTDGGTSFKVVFVGSTASTGDQGQMDIVCTNAGKLFLGVNGGFTDKALRGLWTSNTGDFNSWTRIAGGQTLNVDSVANWRGNSTGSSARRIVLALAPNNQNKLFAMYENGLSQAASKDIKPEVDLFKFDFSNNSVTNLSSNMPDLAGQQDGVDPLTTQSGYNMCIAVKPDNENIVLIGATNLYRSTDGFSTTSNTKNIGGYGPNLSPLRIYTNSHPDFHNLVFDPSNPNKLFAANDGGLQVTNDVIANINNANNEVVAWTMVNNYQTLQYYAVGIDPTPGQENYIGGAQDNGTHIRIGGASTPNNHNKLLGGDGATAAIAQVSGSSFTFFCTIQSGTLYRDVTNSFTEITPVSLTANPDGGFGDFVTYTKMNFDNPEQLYYVNYNRLFRTTASTSVTSNTWDELTGVAITIPATFTLGSSTVKNSIRAIELTRGTYSSSHTMYIGTAQGKIYRLDDPRNAAITVSPIEIGPAAIAAGSNIADIAVNPNDDNEVMAVISNYNTTSIWWTNNAKSTSPTWKNAEGNLTLPSIRSCMIVVKKDASNNPSTEYYVGTSVGLYGAENIATVLQNNGNVSWAREGGSTLGFAVVVSMDYRPQDNTLLIGTHGNGMFAAKTGTPNYNPSTGGGGGNGSFFVKMGNSVTANYVSIISGNLTGVSAMQIRVHNMAGQLLLQKQLPYTDTRLDVTTLPAGVYVLTVLSTDGKEKLVQQFIKL